jgi:type IV secretory pathway VirB10-like protein
VAIITSGSICTAFRLTFQDRPVATPREAIENFQDPSSLALKIDAHRTFARCQEKPPRQRCALFFALQPVHETAGSELYNIDNRSTPDGLANLPRDYTGLPRNAPQLGPPLPGNLGRPILNAGASPDPEQQRIAQEREAARTSHLFATTNTRQIAAVATPGAAPVYDGPVPSAVAGSSDLTAQDHKLAFLNGAVDRRTVSPDRVQAPASPYVLQAGTVIPAALITGLPPTFRARSPPRWPKTAMTARSARSS